MKELSLHLLDIAQNCLTAGAKHVEILMRDSVADDLVEIAIKDDGHGMDAELLARVTEPFTTTRTTRKLGMGLPLFQMAAEMTGGELRIESEPGVGTTVRASFVRSHIDTPPLGDMAETIVTLIHGAPDVEFLYRYETDAETVQFDTTEMREILEDVPLDEPDVLAWIRGHLRELMQN
ncbi:MAG: ATP-binding protein [Oscillospiraceae bacterium]|nr:ATP-binding protein [Oscillospiraceae bacterium]